MIFWRRRIMINFTTSLICFISIIFCVCRNGTGSWVHASSHNDHPDGDDDVNEKIIMNKMNHHHHDPHHLLNDLKKKENLHLTSLLQDDLSYLEDVMMEKEHQYEIVNRILYGGDKTTNNGGSASYESQHRYLEDEEEMLTPPTCIAPPSSSSSLDTNTTNANSTGNLGPAPPLPESTNFTGILLLEMVGRPTTISDNETEIMELVILATYRNLSICEQTGIVRQIYQVEIIPDIFGFSPRGGRINNNDEVPEDDNETDTTTTTTTDDEDEEDRRHRHNRRLLWEQDGNGEHHTILWKTPNEYFEWNRRRYDSHRYLQQQQEQQQGTGNRNNNTANNNTANNNTANTGGGGGGNILRPVTQPFNWLVRLTGTCNGCALQPSLFDDISITPFQRQRRNLLHSQFHTETTNDNKNNNRKYDNTPPIRGGGGGRSPRTLMKNETDTSIETNTNTTTVEICNCPGPKSELFQKVLNDTIYQLVDEGIIQSIDIIDDTPELIPTSPTTCGGGRGQAGDDGDEESPLLQKFSASLVLTLKACPNQFLQNDDAEEDPTVLSPLEVLALAYQKSFNELNLLNGGRTCDPFARRLTDATAMLEENPEDMLQLLQMEAENACIGDNIPYISIRLNLEAECLGCEGILFEPEDLPEDDGTRQLLRKLKDDDAEPNPYSDLFPFCFCPKGTPSRGIKASELFEVFNTTLDIFQQEGRGGNEFIDVEVEEVSDVAAEPSCGNGILDLPEEECDDGNTIDGDSCTNNCTLAICGDGILTLDGSEECDDGNDIDTDECTNGCRLVINNSTNNSTNITIPPTMSNSSNITDFPSKTPSMIPTITPSMIPSMTPSSTSPITTNSSNITDFPSKSPSMKPSMSPSMTPSMIPSMTPTLTPSTTSPTTSPSVGPSTTLPSVTPTMTPSEFPSTVPSDDPSSKPSMSPSTTSPSVFPTPTPTHSPSKLPSNSPSWFPSVHDDCLGISCGPGGTCIDEVDTYSCICDIGYKNLDPDDPTSLCKVIDECPLGSPHFFDDIPDPYPCPPNRECFTTEGSFTCNQEVSGPDLFNGACLEEGASSTVDHRLNNRHYCNNNCSPAQIRKLECGGLFEGVDSLSDEVCRCIKEYDDMLQNDCGWEASRGWCDIRNTELIKECQLDIGDVCNCEFGHLLDQASNTCVPACDVTPCGDRADCSPADYLDDGYRCDCPSDSYFNGITCVPNPCINIANMSEEAFESLDVGSCPTNWSEACNTEEYIWECHGLSDVRECCLYGCPSELPRYQICKNNYDPSCGPGLILEDCLSDCSRTFSTASSFQCITNPDCSPDNNVCIDPCDHPNICPNGSCTTLNAGYKCDCEFGDLLDQDSNTCVPACDVRPCGDVVGCLRDESQVQGYRCDCPSDSLFNGIECVPNQCSGISDDDFNSLAQCPFNFPDACGEGISVSFNGCLQWNTNSCCWYTCLDEFHQTSYCRQ